MADHLDTVQVPNISRYDSSGALLNISQRVANDKIYQIQNGVAVIVNNKRDEGSKLKTSFEKLKFDIRLLDDASTQDVKDTINKIKGELKDKHERTDCLVFVFLTNGTEDLIFTTDGKLNISEVMEEFSVKNCRELVLKPKIFIFQACRGEEIGRGVDARIIRYSEQRYDKADVERKTEVGGAMKTETTKEADIAIKTEKYDEMFPGIIRIPNEADFLAIYCASFEYGSSDNTEKASPFVRVLSEELVRMEPGEDFYKVLIRVNRKVGTGFKPNDPENNFITQMPCFISHLTKDLILKQ